jgi:hypothetical protein
MPTNSKDQGIPRHTISHCTAKGKAWGSGFTKVRACEQGRAEANPIPVIPVKSLYNGLPLAKSSILFFLSFSHDTQYHWEKKEEQ